MFKIIVALATVFFAGEAMATNEVRWPMLGGAYVNQLCVAPDSIQSLEPIRLCAEYKEAWEGHGKEKHRNIECVRYENRIVRIPRSEMRQTCTEYKRVRYSKDDIRYECSAYEAREYFFSTVFEVPVYKTRLGHDRDPEVLYTFTYTLPVCEE